MRGQLITVFHLALDVDDVREIQLRIDTAGVEIHGQGEDIDIAGSLAVTEQRALDPFGTGQAGLLGGGNPGAPVIVRMDADDHAVTTAEMPAKPFDLIGEDIGRGDFDGSR